MKDLYAPALAAVLPVAMTWMAPLSFGQIAVVTQRYDNSRSGANLNETVLMPANVNQNSFGLLFTRAVDGQLYAQPLYVPNLTVNGTTQNVVFVATENNNVYAFDADNPSAASPLWFVSLGTPVPATAICTENTFPDIGITSTPVIDLGASPPRMYVVAKTLESDGSIAQRLHVLDITTGHEVSGSPIVISASINSHSGVITFDPVHELNRPALLLYAGYVYLAFSSHCDANPWYGWVLAYSTSNLSAPPLVLNTAPTNSEVGIWQSGQGLAADQTGIYLMTGNGYFTYSIGGTDLGDSFIRLTPSLSVVDYFTPWDQFALSNADNDFGAGGPLLLPSLPGTPLSLAVGGGKDGRLFVLDRANLGGYNSNTNNVVQTLGSNRGIFGAPVFWAGPSGQYLYTWAKNDFLNQYVWNAAAEQFQAAPIASSSTTADHPGGAMALSANGSTNGILWATTTYQQGADYGTIPGVLHAFDATNVSVELWNSRQNLSQDDFGLYAKFCPPMIANGKVYVSTFSNILAVYGLLTPKVAAPAFSLLQGTYTSAQQVSLSTTTPGASIRYTTDGSMPSETIGALWISGNPISVSATTTINAIAYEGGYRDSTVSTATYTINSGGAGTAPTFVQSNASATLSSADSQSVAFTSNATPGNNIFVFAQYYNGPVTATVSDTCNDQFSEIAGSPVAAGGGAGTAHWFIARNINGGACTVTVSYRSTTGYGGIAIFEVSGVVGSTITLDKYASGTGNSALASASITPTQASSFAIAQVWSGNGGGFSLGGGWTTQERLRFSTLYQSNLAGWQALSSAAPVGLSTAVGGGPWIAMIANFYSLGGGTTSQVAAPAFSPPAETYTQPIAISTPTPNATIRYTTDGSNPSQTNGTVYTTAITLTASTTIKAIAYEAGYTDSAIASASYTVSSGTVATPSFSPPAGTYTQPITISTTTPNATIRYTTDGSNPSQTNGTIYTTAITLTASTTIKAIAYEAGYTDSAIASGTYTFGTATRALVQSNATGSSFPGNRSQSVAFTSSVAAGNTIFVFAQYYNAPVAATASDTCNDQFTEITGSPVAASGGAGTAHWFIARNVNGGACTVTVSYSSPTLYGGVAVFEVSGLGGSSVTLDQYASGAGNGLVASASITPTQASSFAIAQVWSGSGGGFSLGGDWTTQERTRFSTLYQSNLVGWEALSSTAPVGLSTPVAGGPWIAMIANFYSSGGGTTSQVAAPAFNPPAGAYTQPIAISTTTPNATIRYTTDGSNPSRTNGTVYSTAITVIASTTIKAIAYEAGYTDSAIASAGYTVSSSTVATPSFSPPAGAYTQPVAISTTTPNATIRYTTDGSNPSQTNGTIYTTPIVLTASTTIKAIAYEAGYSDSAIASASYTVSSGPVATPSFSPPAGPYTQPVAISTTTPNATIRYTTDGSNPSQTNGTIYTTVITLTASTTIKAIAYEAGYSDSAIASGTYTFGTIPPALVQSNATGSSFPGNSSQSVAFTSSVTAGNTIFVFVQYYNGPVTATVSDTCNDQFTQITGSPVAANGGAGTAHWFIARNVNGGSCTVTVSYSSPTLYGGVAVFEVSGLGGSGVTLDQYASGTGSGLVASASITPTQPSSFAIAQVWSADAGGLSLGGNWTTQERARFSTLYRSNLAGWQVLSSTAPVGLSITVGNGPWIAMIANFH
jgi:AraC-like DNA-binding protein